MVRNTAKPQDETTPLLSQDSTAQDEPRGSLARRRSSAFLSFLSEPEDKDSDGYGKFHRKRAVYLIVFLYMTYNISIGLTHPYFFELIQTLACAEYYYASNAQDPRFPGLPSAGDPLELCSVPSVDKRISQVATYTTVFGAASSCIISLLLAKGLLPRFRRRTLAMAPVVVSMTVAVVLVMIPTHYSFDPAVASSSTMHPTTALNFFLAVIVIGSMLGAQQTALPLIVQAMILDVVREDERTSGLSQLYAGVTIGLSLSSVVLGLVLPYFNVHFSILHHSGPFSPFWLPAIVLLLTLILMYFWLPETRSFAKVVSASRRNSVSSHDRLHRNESSAERQATSAPSPSPSLAQPESWSSTALNGIKGTLSMFGYLLPYRPHPGAAKDYKLPLMLIGVIFSDNISVIWDTMFVFCSTHLHFGPEDITKLVGVLGGTKGAFGLLVLPWVVHNVRHAVKKRLREELPFASTDGLTPEDQNAQREKSAIYTDRIIALVSLGFDCAGFTAMGVAAARLSSEGIYGSEYQVAPPTRMRRRSHHADEKGTDAFLHSGNSLSPLLIGSDSVVRFSFCDIGFLLLMFASGAVPAIQALSVDLFEAQNRPTDDPIAARDAFLGFLNILQTVLIIGSPLINNAIYRWSIDHGLPALVFFWTAFTCFCGVMFIASAVLFVR